MNERELVKQTADVLRSIIRSIDKNLEYRVMEQTQEGTFALRLTTRGREGNVSLRTEQLREAGVNPTSKNAIRQKIKSKRDHLLSNYVVDVMGRRVAKLLKQSRASEDSRPSFSRPSFYNNRRAPMGRRR